MFTVSFLIAIAKILDDIEEFLGKKSKYTKWLKENFGHKHNRLKPCAKKEYFN
jgi:hypothetical protein